MNLISLKIAAPAGFGVMSMGPMFAKVLKRSGFYVMGYPEYPSLIRGGYNSYQLLISDEPVYNPYIKTDILLTFTKLSFEKEKIDENVTVIADFEKLKVDKEKINAQIIDIPLSKILKENKLKDIVKNTLALGYIAKLLKIDYKIFEDVIKETMPEKHHEINLSALKIGYDICNNTFDFNFEKKDYQNHIIVTGNESAALSAIASGVNFYSTYPMTPASTVLHFLAKYARDYGIIVKHTEDEIAGVTMAIGAAYAGARAMTGTSGGGFSLMVEGLGLAAITETPILFFISQRPGPATGMPTWQEQADLKFVLNASQDEFVRAVFTPGDITELFYAVNEALNIAEKYQIPVFVLSDKYLSESLFMDTEFNLNALKIDRGSIFEGDKDKPLEFFPRYKEVKDGIPKRAFPGTIGGIHKTPSNEHDEYGFVSDDAKVRKLMQDRRFKKVNSLVNDMPQPKLYGDQTAETTFVCWGSTKTVLLEAMKYNKHFNFIHFPTIYPINWNEAKALLQSANKLVLIENNFLGQLGQVIAENSGIIIEDKFLKYDGRPFFTEEILEYLGE